jgi:hypothetical protein
LWRGKSFDASEQTAQRIAQSGVIRWQETRHFWILDRRRFIERDCFLVFGLRCLTLAALAKKQETPPFPARQTTPPVAIKVSPEFMIASPPQLQMSPVAMIVSRTCR